MKVILTGIGVALMLSVVGGLVMTGGQEPAWEVYSTSSTRVGDPGHNLVGPNWSGDSKVQRKSS